MEPRLYAVILGALAFAAASFFFALAETALFALGKWRARHLAHKDSRRGLAVLRLLEHPRDLLASIVFANSFSNAMMVILGVWLGLSHDWSLGWTLGVTFCLILLLCEVTPKTLAVRMPEVWALRIATPMQWIVHGLSPLRNIVQNVNQAILRKTVPASIKPHVSVTDEDYEELIEMAYQQGTLAHAEKEIIYEIVNLDQSTVADVMLPRTQMEGISIDLDRESMEEKARHYRHRHLVLYDESLDNIVGFLNSRTLLLFPGADLDECIELPSFVPESMNLLQLFKSLQRQKRHIAVVVDEFGGTAGLVTMKDIIEQMIGEIRREDEPEDVEMKKLGPGRWQVRGTMRLEDFAEEYPRLKEIPEVDTMAGIVLAIREVIPPEGDSVDYCGLRMTVLQADERRIHRILVEQIP